MTPGPGMRCRFGDKAHGADRSCALCKALADALRFMKPVAGVCWSAAPTASPPSPSRVPRPLQP
eukprot:CAMPEP_0174382656 /NCGR_PEP_ID=MMETSP0811_2-20130205/124727_1 /TAXON_ID=73025 ORGANISM="Eutreptiella gymnastica-like, Strain CCMP1594" /NCGR_SAMPLE_ID=MMETSP0811_2 /ASSEMBLY_ACC=CAM_ASM_000667 /LENGTH=63 /DNA_ID=CAMNT_0015536009 /DNA_START=1637 /DNA_END=1825 /DNA_ORIENTATION=+